MQKVSTGINGLDCLIDYIYLGDNVVWEVDSGTSYEIFIRKFIETSAKEAKEIIYVSFNKSVPTLIKEFGSYVNEKFHIIDGFTAGKGKNDSTFLRNYDEISNRVNIIKLIHPCNLDELTEAINEIESKINSPTVYVFDSLTGIQNLVKDEGQTHNFFTYMCPRLFDLESIAYWILERDAHSQKFKANIRHITQVVLELYRRKDNFFIKALKLSRRKNRDALKPHTYEITENDEILIKTNAESMPFLDIGGKLREIRISKKISQKELADKVNLTAGFISQMENNQIVPSLTSFLQICEALGVKVSDILKEEKSKEHPVIKKESIFSKPPLIHSDIEIYQIISNENINVSIVIIPPNSSLDGQFLMKKKPEIIQIQKGQLIANIDGNNFSLTEGDFLYTKNSIPQKLQNKGGDKVELLTVSI
ncbi:MULTISPECIES: helix-turn-helix domain-containing protein [Thermodesulfovibrio]|uniref:helix-turn-helix domain-containing protein n=1 Tax=Thermodesulfovibrio TaxID=28261 RepID=UPI00260EAC5A|nr:helix-turn-helix domain-containing protein [Thermodesulfovibrio sp.]